MNEEHHENPLAHFTEHQLVAEHSKSGANSHFLSEMLRRHKQESSKLGDRVRWLNLWLLVFTVAIFALTGVLVWTSLREVGDLRRQSTDAAPASRAGGAWMLWTEDKSVSLLGGVSVEWSPPVAFADRAACMTFLDTQVKKWDEKPNKGQSAILAETGTEAEFRTRSGEDRHAVHLTKRAFCLPDTVDPRPKGK